MMHSVDVGNVATTTKYCNFRTVHSMFRGNVCTHWHFLSVARADSGAALGETSSTASVAQTLATSWLNVTPPAVTVTLASQLLLLLCTFDSLDSAISVTD